MLASWLNGGRISAEGLASTARPISAATARLNRGRLVVGPEPPDVEIVDDLVEQIPDVVDEGDVALDVPGHAEPHQYVEAEAVRRLDRGGIEVGDRLRQPVAASFDLIAGASASTRRTSSAGSTGTPPRTSDSQSAALTRRSRTRSRSSPVAMRVKVMTSRRSSGVPSAT